MQEVEEHVTAAGVSSQQRLVETQRCRLAGAAEHLAQCQAEQQRDLVARAV